MPIQADNPIETSAEDTLGRASVATAMVAEIRSADATKGLVVGILGPWGTGKTSLLNLVRQELSLEPAVIVLDFNPWLFSGAEQLAEHFFDEIGAQLKDVYPQQHALREQLGGVVDTLARYGKTVAPLKAFPVIGSIAEVTAGASALVLKLRETPEKSLATQRTELEQQLLSLDQPIVIVLDDIDRLESQEIREIFKLIRLTASVPNFIYLVAFDRIRVEQALSYEGLVGRDYLEKIIQVAYDLPATSDTRLSDQILKMIDQALSDFPEPGPIDVKRWQDIYPEVIRPLVDNMRDARRYAASVRFAVRSLEGAVSLEDLLALEAIRLFLPDSFAVLAREVDVFTFWPGRDTFGSALKEPRKAIVDEFIAAAGPYRETALSVIRRVFPVACEHLGGNPSCESFSAEIVNKKRLADRRFAHLYFDHLASQELESVWSAEKAVANLANGEAIALFFRELEPSRWGTLISDMALYESRVPCDGVSEAVAALLNLLPEAPSGSSSLLSLASDMQIVHMSIRLLSRCAGSVDMAGVAVEVFNRLETLSSKLTFVDFIGYHPEHGHQLVTQEQATDLELLLRREIRGVSSSELLGEVYLDWLITWVRGSAAENEGQFELPDDGDLACALLRKCFRIQRSQEFGTRVVQEEPFFDKARLISLLGSEEAALRTVALCHEAPHVIYSSEALETAERSFAPPSR